MPLHGIVSFEALIQQFCSYCAKQPAFPRSSSGGRTNKRTGLEAHSPGDQHSSKRRHDVIGPLKDGEDSKRRVDRGVSEFGWISLRSSREERCREEKGHSMIKRNGEDCW